MNKKISLFSQQTEEIIWKKVMSMKEYKELYKEKDILSDKLRSLIKDIPEAWDLYEEIFGTDVSINNLFHEKLFEEGIRQGVLISE